MTQPFKIVPSKVWDPLIGEYQVMTIVSDAEHIGNKVAEWGVHKSLFWPELAKLKAKRLRHCQHENKRLQSEIDRLRAALECVRHEICIGPAGDTLWHRIYPSETTVDFICNTLNDNWDYDAWLSDNAEKRPFHPFGEPETVELRLCDDGVRRWHLATREGWQVTGLDDGTTLMLTADHFTIGTKITLCEPIETADQPRGPQE